MKPEPRAHRILPPALFLLGCLALSTLSCSTISKMFASPTPTFTPTLTPTLTPTITPTPVDLLTPAQRAGYLVVLRYVGEPVHAHFSKIQNFLTDKGYSVTVDSGPSAVGDMDIILYGQPKCLTAIDDLTSLLAGKLDLKGLSRERFNSMDQSFLSPNIVIQIKSVGLFGPGF